MNLILSRQKNCQWNSGWELGWLIKLSSWSWQELEEKVNSLLFPRIRQWQWLLECRRERQHSIWKHCNISEWWKCRLSMIGKQCKRQMTSLSLSLLIQVNLKWVFNREKIWIWRRNYALKMGWEQMDEFMGPELHSPSPALLKSLDGLNKRRHVMLKSSIVTVLNLKILSILKDCNKGLASFS